VRWSLEGVGGDWWGNWGSKKIGVTRGGEKKALNVTSQLKSRTGAMGKKGFLTKAVRAVAIGGGPISAGDWRGVCCCSGGKVIERSRGGGGERILSHINGPGVKKGTEKLDGSHFADCPLKQGRQRKNRRSKRPRKKGCWGLGLRLLATLSDTGKKMVSKWKKGHTEAS